MIIRKKNALSMYAVENQHMIPYWINFRYCFSRVDKATKEIEWWRFPNLLLFWYSSWPKQYFTKRFVKCLYPMFSTSAYFVYYVSVNERTSAWMSIHMCCFGVVLNKNVKHVSLLPDLVAVCVIDTLCWSYRPCRFGWVCVGIRTLL